MQIFVKHQIYKTMKTLQNNFTTPEQSKRLLELGVPADSADCISFIVTDKGKDFFDAVECGTQIIRPLLPRDSYTNVAFPSDGSRFVEEPFPCWSVGRLIEIHRVSTTLPEEQYMLPFWYDTQDNVEWAIRVLESGIRTGNMDFSKLEE